jgi:hypothetical protein
MITQAFAEGKAFSDAEGVRPSARGSRRYALPSVERRSAQMSL